MLPVEEHDAMNNVAKQLAKKRNLNMIKVSLICDFYNLAAQRRIRLQLVFVDILHTC